MVWLVALGSVVLISFLILLCTKRKKRSVTVVSYGPKLSQDLSANVTNEEVAASVASHHNDSLNRAGSEGRRSHSLSVASQRGLPDLPPESSEPTNNSIKRSSSRTGTGSIDGSSHNDIDSHHSSPKGRKLPNPPQNEEVIPVNNLELHEQQDEEDMYAKVGDTDEKSLKPTFKVLHIKEGSGDSSFYAKVGGDEEVDVDLYAQVDDNEIKLNGQSTSNDAPNLDSPIEYGDAEYASIDKIKKTSVKRKATTSSDTSQTEPPAPPIPDRNFDIEDEEEIEAQNLLDASTQQESDEESIPKGPMYDKLCVRESLDHLRKREEVEHERKVRYANVSAINENANGVYAQIDDPGPEGLYESLSVAGSADGTFIPPQPNNAVESSTSEYTSITEMNNSQPEISEANGTTVQVLNNQRAPPKQHYYEQIERKTDP